MKSFGLTLLTAIVGGAIAVGAYKAFEPANHGLSFEDQQKVYFASNKTPQVMASSTGELDFTEAAAAVTPAVVYIRTTYSASDNGAQDQMEQMFGQMFGGGRLRRKVRKKHQAQV